VNYYSPYNVAVNDFNQFVAISGTDHSHQRLAVFDGANFNTIAYFYGSSPYLTPSPAGGTFAGLNELAINASGQVMVIATANNGPSGLFFYDGSTWQTVCAIGSCQIGGETITQANFLRASNNKFCALFNSTVGNQQIDCWEAGAWTILIKRGDNTSDGTQINGFGTYDINRLGDVAVTLYTGLNGPSAFLKTGDTGSYFTVQAALFPASDGAYFQGIYALDLRDDRRVFLLVQDFFGRLIAYEADPQF